MSKRKNRRLVPDYLASALELAKFVPNLKKYKRRKTLTRWEKGAITRVEKKLRYARNLTAVDERFAKLRPDLLFAPGVRAVEMANTGNVKLKTYGEDLIVVSNGRDWLYQSIPHITKIRLRKAAEKVFNDFDENYDIEAILGLARTAFENPKVLAVHLWTERGRASEAFRDLQTFLQWLNDRWQAYKEHQSWMKGIAILYGNAADARAYRAEIAAMRKAQALEKKAKAKKFRGR